MLLLPSHFMVEFGSRQTADITARAASISRLSSLMLSDTIDIYHIQTVSLDAYILESSGDVQATDTD